MDRRTRLEDLYASHIEGAVRLAYLLTGDREKAQDIGHDAFVKIVGRLHDLRHPEAFPAYLRSIVINLSRSHLRRLRSERNYERQVTPQVETIRRDVEEQERLRQALAQLPFRQRAVVVLRYYEDMSEQQTAQVLGCSTSAVKALAARGLKTLRASLEMEDR